MKLALLSRLRIDLYSNLIVALMILLKFSVIHCFNTAINLVAIGDFFIFGLSSGVANTL